MAHNEDSDGPIHMLVIRRIKYMSMRTLLLAFDRITKEYLIVELFV
jgi:hypothetical protein